MSDLESAQTALLGFGESEGGPSDARVVTLAGVPHADGPADT